MTIPAFDHKDSRRGRALSLAAMMPVRASPKSVRLPRPRVEQPSRLLCGQAQPGRLRYIRSALFRRVLKKTRVIPSGAPTARRRRRAVEGTGGPRHPSLRGSLNSFHSLRSTPPPMNSLAKRALARELLLPCEIFFVALPPPGAAEPRGWWARRRSRRASARFEAHPGRQIAARVFETWERHALFFRDSSCRR
jgi:hypothetical protein